MKNKSKLMFLLKLVLFILIIILILIILFLYNFLTNKRKDTPKVINKWIVKEYSIKNMDKLSFDFKNYEVKYLTTNKDKLIIKQNGTVSKMYIDKQKINSKLLIKEAVSNIFDKKKYKIYIPEEYKGSISIDNGFSNISINNLEEVKLNNNAGNVKIKNIKNIIFQNVSGSIYIDGEPNNISGSSSTGSIMIDKIYGSCDIETITGDIKIKKFLIEDASKIETTSGDIYIKVDKKSNCILNYDTKKDYSITEKKCLNGENELKLKNVTGNIIIK